jgi:deferrochelatase/peroxidase EfeB
MTKRDVNPAGGIGRRQMLAGGAAVLAGAAASARVASANAGPAELAPVVADSERAVPFHGVRQNGAIRATTPASAFLSFDLTVAKRSEVIDLMQVLTREARELTAGGELADQGVGAPPTDNLMLGVKAPSDGLSITVGVGDSLFDDRFGLDARRPAKLAKMRTFPNDDLDPAICHGDLSVYIQARHQDAVLRAVRLIARATRGAMQVRWRYDGFTNPPRPTGRPRNALGFKDGISNPDTASSAQMDELVWVHGGRSGEPGWTTGGTYQVLRVIRCLVEFWDRVSLTEQEQMFGRSKAVGAPLTGTHENDIPDYASDPKGYVIFLNSHIRKANPRTPATADSRILRRSVSYDQGMDSDGNLDTGLLFLSYQQDIHRQFEATQTRLIDEPLVDYILPVGGGYFFVLPGVRDSKDWFARALLS